MPARPLPRRGEYPPNAVLKTPRRSQVLAALVSRVMASLVKGVVKTAGPHDEPNA